MRKLVLLIVSLCLVLPLAATAADQIKQVDRPQDAPSFLGYKPNEFVVVMKPDVGKLIVNYSADDVAITGRTDFDLISDRFRVNRIRQQFAGADPGDVRTRDLARFHKVRFQSGNLDEVMAAYARNPMVERVEPIGIHLMHATPNDGYYDPYQTYHNQANDHDIDSPEAWDIQTGNSSIIVADLDSGTRYYHPDLGGVNASPTNVGASRGNMWINNAELNGSAGVDDDGNGYVDDWIGYDFIDGVSNCWSGEDCNDKDNDPRDFNGHGTHTAGIVGMMTNDGYGMAGTAGGWGNGSQSEYGNGVKVMALRMGYSYNYLGQEYGVVMMDAAAEAFYYAADNGARIATCSWGSSNSGGIGAAVDYFLNHGGLIFVAAGNDGSQTADYLNGRGDCISVAAVDVDDSEASFTTYGTWVDISAPGVTIYATYHDHTDPNTNYWAALDGTSMATPMTAAVGALIWSQNPTWTAAQVESQLYASADNIDAYLSSGYIGKMGAGRINSYHAVNTGPPPAPVAAFVGSPTSGTAPLTVSFTDQSTGSITAWSWAFGDGGTSTAQNPSHQYASAGAYTVSLTVTGPGGSDGETKTNYITVDPCVAPTAAFVGAPTSGEAPLAVSFTDQSTGSPASWSWNFGDGGTSTAQNPSHSYSAAGTYTVTLTASNGCGSDQAVRTDYVTVTEPGPASYAYSSGEASVIGSVSGSHLDTHASDDVRETISEIEYTGHPRKRYSYLEHRWSFNVASGSAVTFHLEASRTNNTEGDDFVFAYSTDGSTWIDMVTVNSAAEQIYEAALPNDLAGAVTVRVVDTNRSWGNLVLDDLAIDHMYFASESAGPTPPAADFVGSPTSGAPPLSVQFTDLSTGDPASWSWDFGDGNTSTAQNPGHTYVNAGTYTVSLTATNAYGSDTATKTDYITVAISSNEMYVFDLTVAHIGAGGGNKRGQATVTIYTDSNQPLAGAAVTGGFTGLSVEPGLTAATDANGQVVFQTTAAMKTGGGEWCFEVTDVTHASYTYNPSMNQVTASCAKTGDLYGGSGEATLLSNRFEVVTETALGRSGPRISFNLPDAGHVRVEIFDVSGRQLEVLADRGFGAGRHTLAWNADRRPSGVYFYRVANGNKAITNKLVLIR